MLWSQQDTSEQWQSKGFQKSGNSVRFLPFHGACLVSLTTDWAPPSRCLKLNPTIPSPPSHILSWRAAQPSQKLRGPVTRSFPHAEHVAEMEGEAA